MTSRQLGFVLDQQLQGFRKARSRRLLEPGRDKLDAREKLFVLSIGLSLVAESPLSANDEQRILTMHVFRAEEIVRQILGDFEIVDCELFHDKASVILRNPNVADVQDALDASKHEGKWDVMLAKEEEPRGFIQVWPHFLSLNECPDVEN